MSLQRFVDAQTPLYENVETELRSGRKRTHWMWFVFPQLRGLGVSPMARHFGIASLDEARDYLRDPVLGPRLDACTQLVLDISGRTLREIFGSPDDVKFRSSMTLFSLAADGNDSIFARALERYWDGSRDDATLALLDAASGETEPL